MTDRSTGPEPKVVIVILNWNKLELTTRCVRALRDLAYGNHEVTVVDNGSTEKGADGLAGEFPGVQVMMNERNLGYAGGNNAAMAEAFARGADYVWLLNNDATPEAATLDSLVRCAEADPRIGMVSPVLHRHPGAGDIEAAGAVFNLRGFGIEVTQSVDQAAAWQRDMPHRVAVFGTALLIQRAAFSAVGGFDELFFAYDEDIDLSIRMAQAGFLNVVDTRSRIFHLDRPKQDHGSKSPPPHVKYYMTRNNIILWAKHGGWKARLKVAAWELHSRLNEVLAHPDEHDQNRAALAGWWDGVRLAGGPYSSARQMPAPARLLLLACPRLWLRLLR